MVSFILCSVVELSLKYLWCLYFMFYCWVISEIFMDHCAWLCPCSLVSERRPHAQSTWTTCVFTSPRCWERWGKATSMPLVPSTSDELESEPRYMYVATNGGCHSEYQYQCAWMENKKPLKHSALFVCWMSLTYVSPFFLSWGGGDAIAYFYPEKAKAWKNHWKDCCTKTECIDDSLLYSDSFVVLSSWQRALKSWQWSCFPPQKIFSQLLNIVSQ